MRKSEAVVLWGLAFVVFYLYAYQAVTAIQWVPTPCAIPEHAEEPRDVPEALFWSCNRLHRILWGLSIPTVGISQRVLADEPYYSELVYIPFINAFQWFGYGVLFGWWRYRRTRAGDGGGGGQSPVL